MVVKGSRLTVNRGKLRLRANDPRSREKETAFDFWGGSGTVYSRVDSSLDERQLFQLSLSLAIDISFFS